MIGNHSLDILTIAIVALAADIDEKGFINVKNPSNASVLIGWDYEPSSIYTLCSDVFDGNFKGEI